MDPPEIALCIIYLTRVFLIAVLRFIFDVWWTVHVLMVFFRREVREGRLCNQIQKSTFIHIKAMFVRLTKDAVIVIGHVM